MSIAATLIARPMPSDAPDAAASMMLTCGRSGEMRTRPRVTGSSSSGRSSFARYRLAGAAITLVARAATGSAPTPMYTTIMPPETVASPPVIRDNSSDRVICAMYRLDDERHFRHAHEHVGGGRERLGAARAHHLDHHGGHGPHHDLDHANVKQDREDRRDKHDGRQCSERKDKSAREQLRHHGGIGKPAEDEPCAGIREGEELLDDTRARRKQLIDRAHAADFQLEGRHSQPELQGKSPPDRAPTHVLQGS